ncbi:MAG TPA: ribulose-phosphate 3-epimerase [Armatimonadota bacterium]|nr:ribulose-phosphate 3-epimerase [Armatimonadota bacterium]HOP80951.1 ribulose-phosphate 3-epimerase [Armatimonadota bacterium]HPP74228.1 ribulose-phosphate 3-epimerase [Armatimonadota bacterium]
MVLIEASILAADLMRIGEQIREAEEAGVDGFQIDVMDGHFVSNITFGPDTVRAMRLVSHKFLDVHLMITNPERYLEVFTDAGADRLVVHIEGCLNIHHVLQSIRDLGVEAGVALNPGTPLCAVEELIGLADVIQVMTVHPGLGGQKLILSQLDKIRRLRQLLDERGLSTLIAVDGGINTSTAPEVVACGAKILVSGTSIYGSPQSVKENVEKLRASVHGCD